MEIKTLEQYAISKISYLENQVATLEMEKQELEQTITKLQDTVRMVKNRLSTAYLSSSRTAYVSMESVFESSDPKEYDLFLKRFGLKEPERLDDGE